MQVQVSGGSSILSRNKDSDIVSKSQLKGMTRLTVMIFGNHAILVLTRLLSVLGDSMHSTASCVARCSVRLRGYMSEEL